MRASACLWIGVVAVFAPSAVAGFAEHADGEQVKVLCECSPIAVGTNACGDVTESPQENRKWSSRAYLPPDGDLDLATFCYRHRNEEAKLVCCDPTEEQPVETLYRGEIEED